MTDRKHDSDWLVREQVIHDAQTGITLYFSVVPDPSSPYRLLVVSDKRDMARELLFDAEGRHSGSASIPASRYQVGALRIVK